MSNVVLYRSFEIISSNRASIQLFSQLLNMFVPIQISTFIKCDFMQKIRWWEVRELTDRRTEGSQGNGYDAWTGSWWWIKNNYQVLPYIILYMARSCIPYFTKLSFVAAFSDPRLLNCQRKSGAITLLHILRISSLIVPPPILDSCFTIKLL